MDSDVLLLNPMTDFECPECGVLVERRKAGPHRSGHVRSANAKYVYKDGDIHHPYEMKACPTCRTEQLIRKDKTYCSYRCSKLGDLNPAKQKASHHGLTPTEYAAAHTRVRKVRGKASGCGHCGTTEDRMYHWANISGNYSDVQDFMSLCVPCHDRFDRSKARKKSQ